ncbi:MAG: hypothetical protein M3N43_08240 [Actinomycetota bacterium]|nr:hypothetical protein [Actinomycetota bacterium]
MRQIRAEIVVLACYALENARLLLASGINENGQVGQHFMTTTTAGHVGSARVDRPLHGSTDRCKRHGRLHI